MYDEDQSPGVTFVAGLLLGAAVGAGTALLMAPQSGRRTRRQIARATENMRDSASDHLDDWGDDLRSKMQSGRRRLRL